MTCERDGTYTESCRVMCIRICAVHSLYRGREVLVMHDVEHFCGKQLIL